MHLSFQLALRLLLTGGRLAAWPYRVQDADGCRQQQPLRALSSGLSLLDCRMPMSAAEGAHDGWSGMTARSSADEGGWGSSMVSGAEDSQRYTPVYGLPDAAAGSSWGGSGMGWEPRERYCSMQAGSSDAEGSVRQPVQEKEEEWLQLQLPPEQASYQPSAACQSSRAPWESLRVLESLPNVGTTQLKLIHAMPNQLPGDLHSVLSSGLHQSDILLSVSRSTPPPTPPPNQRPPCPPPALPLPSLRRALTAPPLPSTFSVHPPRRRCC